MSELSPQSRALLQRAMQEGSGPTADDRARVHEAVMAEAAVTMLGLGAVSKLGALKSAAIFVVAATMGSAVVAVTGHALRSENAPPPPLHVVEKGEPPMVMEPMEMVTEAPAPEPVAVKRTPEKKLSEVVATPTPEIAPTPEPARRPAVARCEMQYELSALQAAQENLSANPQAALSQLDAFDRECPDTGALLEERRATAALALGATGQKEAGVEILQWLRAEHPTSPSLARVAQVCEGK